MKKSYTIKLAGQLIGETRLEYGDPPMGVVFGEIINSNNVVNYEFIKSYCQKNGIELAGDYPEDQLVSTKTIEQLKVISPDGIEIKALGNQISGMDSEGFEITLEGVDFFVYREEFFHHIKIYEEKFKGK